MENPLPTDEDSIRLFSINREAESLWVQRRAEVYSLAVLEDDQRVRRFIKKGFEAGGLSVSVFESLDDLFISLSMNEYDLLILDRMIGSIDSLRYLEQIKKLKPRMKTLVLSALTGALHRINGLDIGADDYLEKPFHFQELDLRVRRLLGGSIPQLPEATLTYDDLSINTHTHQVTRGGVRVHLSPYEFRLLLVLMSKPTKIFSRAELLDSVWGMDSDPGSNVVDVAVGKLRKKINISEDRKLLYSRRGFGYSLVSDFED